MTRAQKKTAEALAAMLPGASWRPDPYTSRDGDLQYGDGSVLVWFSRPERSDELDERGRRMIVGYEELGAARIGRGGYVLWTKVAA